VLQKIGVAKLAGWIEADVEAVEEKVKEHSKEEMREAAVAHEGWCRKKDENRVRLPPKKEGKVFGGKWQPPRFDFGKGKPLARPKKNKFHRSSVDMLAGAGFTHIHARGQGDLKNCRDKLIDKGYIHPDNFNEASDDDSDNEHNQTRLNREREYNAKRKYKKDKYKKRLQGANQKFEEWLQLKDLIDRAIGSLKGINPPQKGEHTAEREFLSVGKALKGVSSSLFPNWAEWAKGYKGQGKCRMLWQSFEPIADDIIGGGPIKDILIRFIGRPGVNFEAGFKEIVRQKFVKQLTAGNIDEEEDTEFENTKTIPKRFYELDAKEFMRLAKHLGFKLQPEEALRIINVFDEDGGGTVSLEEFLAFTGPKTGKARGDIEDKLAHLSCWETTCPSCGMQNAFTVIVKKGKLSRVELPDHVGRRKMSEFRRLHTEETGWGPRASEGHPELETDLQTLRSMNIKCTARPQYWKREDRERKLQELLDKSRDYRQSLMLQKMVTEGVPPVAPALLIAPNRSEPALRSKLDPTSEVLIRWKPGQITGNNTPSFFQLEFAEKSHDGSGGTSDFRELCRDPESYNANGGMAQFVDKWFKAKGLRPNTSYALRLRAFNGFGASPPAHCVITTAPTPPPQPTKMAATTTSVTLGWQEVSGVQKQISQLEQVFNEADVDGSGSLSRDELMEAIEQKHPRLLRFLQQCKIGTDSGSGEALSVFDRIETDDSEELSWEEFRGFFNSATEQSAKYTRENIDGTKYVLKRCVSEADQEYVEVYRGAQTVYTVHDLQPGHTYQFRVQRLNRDGIPSKHSAPTVIQTLLPTPAAPTVVGHPGCQALRLKWAGVSSRGVGGPQVEVQKGGRAKEQIHQMLTEWTQADEDGDGGLDLKRKFEKCLEEYDTDNNGVLDKKEFAELLRGLGVNPTEARVREAFEMIDTDQSGSVNFKEFKEWWSKDSVTYVLKRDGGLSEEQLAQLGDEANKHGGVFKTTCYRGTSKQYEVLGLQPNTLYHFRIRHCASTSDSTLSKAVEVMTAPLPPSRPAVIASGVNWIDLKWHPRGSKAHRYTVQIKFVEQLPSSSGSRPNTTRRAKGKSSKQAWGEDGVESEDPKWITAYEGPAPMCLVRSSSDCAMVANSVYRVRVQAVNRLGGRSDWSQVIQTDTLERGTEVTLKPQNADRSFPIECSEHADVVVGDTLLFTERLFVDPDTKRELKPSAVGSAQHAMPGGGGKTGETARYNPNLSVSSAGGGGGMADYAAAGAEYLGQRTVAARVISESCVSPQQRELARQGKVTIFKESSNSKHREFRLEVIWCTVERKEAKRYLIQPNEWVNRKQKHMFLFETFRSRWRDDNGRHNGQWLRLEQ
jgi:Ca2+-binding EF-hand superfamily protein